MDLANRVISFRVALFSLIILRILDVTTTYIALSNNIANEMNPFTRYIYDVMGVKNIIYILPLQVFLIIILIYFMYIVIDYYIIKLGDNKKVFLISANIIIFTLIIINIIVSINNILVIAGMI